MARNARQILEQSIKEIEAGHWRKSNLGTCTRDGKNQKLMGCALGLVAFYGDDFETEKNGAVTTYSMRYADSKSSTGVHKAVLALNNTVPRKFQRDNPWNYRPENRTNWEDINAGVYAYNDTDTTTPTRAAQWFKRALKLLPTIKDDVSTQYEYADSLDSLTAV